MNKEIKLILENQLVTMKDSLFIAPTVKEQIRKTEEVIKQDKELQEVKETS